MILGKTVRRGDGGAVSAVICICGVTVTIGACALPNQSGAAGRNVPPIADAGADRDVAVDEVVAFDANASNDPDGALISFEWDFGDGTTGQGRVIMHTLDQVDTFFARLTVEDGNGGRGNRTQRIIVEPSLANHAPRAFIGSGRRTGTATMKRKFVRK